jgi:cell division protein FtsB
MAARTVRFRIHPAMMRCYAPDPAAGLRKDAMRVLIFVLTFVLACAAEPALAQTATDADAPKESTQTTASRYTFNRVESGFLRLDNISGQVAYCSQTSGWTCQALSIEGATDLTGLKGEIARLQDEIASLKKEIATLKDPPPRPPADLAPRSDKGPDVTIKLPTAEEMARAREFIEGAWRRLVEMIVTMQKDLMRKS